MLKKSALKYFIMLIALITMTFVSVGAARATPNQSWVGDWMETYPYLIDTNSISSTYSYIYFSSMQSMLNASYGYGYYLSCSTAPVSTVYYTDKRGVSFTTPGWWVGSRIYNVDNLFFWKVISLFYPAQGWSNSAWVATCRVMR
jgi:hypothetical protein